MTTFKAVRTDRELECPDIDAGLRALGCELVLLGEGVSEDALIAAVGDADLLLMCYTPVTARAWAWPTPQWLGLDLASRTLGLVGVGRIGSSMARMAAGFRMRVVGYSPHTPADELARAGVERVTDLAALLGASDVVSIHATLNDETRGLIGARELGLMKRSAFLINAARGAIVDEAVLVTALLEKRIAGAALDVYSEEPLTRTGHPLSPLFGMENVLLFPHLTFYTAEAMRRLTDDTLARCREILQGRPVLVKSHDPRLRAQRSGVVFADSSGTNCD